MNEIQYKPLETVFRKSGFKFKQLERKGDFALFHKVAEQGPIHPKSFDAGFEVVHITRHDGYEIGGIKIEPAECYPGNGQWGKQGWTYQFLYNAELKFEALIKGTHPVVMDDPTIEDDDEDETIADIVPDSVESKPHSGRGRPRRERSMLKIPDGEFSMKELAAFNGCDYSVADTFRKENPTLIKYSRDERRNPKGKKTNLYVKA